MLDFLKPDHWIGWLGLILVLIAVLIYSIGWLLNAWKVWMFNRTATKHDHRKVDLNWDWKE